MKLALSHRWDLSVAEAQALQSQLVKKVIVKTTFDPSSLRTVAGVDVSVRKNTAWAAAAVLDFGSLQPLDYAVAETPVAFPYVPGLLAFREGPCVLEALQRLQVWPDLFIFDGHGLAHPRRIGLASHMGVILDHPSIGCAKSRLIGTHDQPGNVVGDWSPLCDKGEAIGAVVRSRPGVKPLYVSIGHRVDLDTAIDIVLRSLGKYRLPETTRHAHRLAGGIEPQID
jgi:deoxyribonuclease V